MAMQVILPLRDALAGAGFFVLLGGRMTLQGLLALLTQRPEYKRLTDQLRNANALPALTGITEAARTRGPRIASLCTSRTEDKQRRKAQRGKARRRTWTERGLHLVFGRHPAGRVRGADRQGD